MQIFVTTDISRNVSSVGPYIKNPIRNEKFYVKFYRTVMTIFYLFSINKCQDQKGLNNF